MSAALQVYSRDFDADYFKLSTALQIRIQSAIDRLGQNLGEHPHVRLQGINAYRLRVGDYRVVYQFDVNKGAIYLLAVGHQREVYR